MFLTRALQVTNIRASHALVAQLDRVLGYEPSGRRFESSRVHHTKKPGLVPGFLCVMSFGRVAISSHSRAQGSEHHRLLIPSRLIKRFDKTALTSRRQISDPAKFRFMPLMAFGRFDLYYRPSGKHRCLRYWLSSRARTISISSNTITFCTLDSWVVRA